MDIYVGNLSFDTSEGDIRNEFEAYGRVTTVTVITDRVTGNPLGFAFVDMPGCNQATEAIAAINGKKIKGRVLMVSEATMRSERRRSRVKAVVH